MICTIYLTLKGSSMNRGASIHLHGGWLVRLLMILSLTVIIFQPKLSLFSARGFYITCPTYGATQKIFALNAGTQSMGKKYHRVRTSQLAGGRVSAWLRRLPNWRPSFSWPRFCNAIRLAWHQMHESCCSH